MPYADYAKLGVPVALFVLLAACTDPDKQIATSHAGVDENCNNILAHSDPEGQKIYSKGTKNPDCLRTKEDEKRLALAKVVGSQMADAYAKPKLAYIETNLKLTAARLSNPSVAAEEKLNIIRAIVANMESGIEILQSDAYGLYQNNSAAIAKTLVEGYLAGGTQRHEAIKQYKQLATNLIPLGKLVDLNLQIAFLRAQLGSDKLPENAFTSSPCYDELNAQGEKTGARICPRRISYQFNEKPSQPNVAWDKLPEGPTFTYEAA